MVSLVQLNILQEKVKSYPILLSWNNQIRDHLSSCNLGQEKQTGTQGHILEFLGASENLLSLHSLFLNPGYKKKEKCLKY